MGISPTSMKKLLTLVAIFSLFHACVSPAVSAQEAAFGVSAKFASAQSSNALDKRAILLKDFLDSYKSPLANHAATFVEAADNNSLDWKLVASIAGVESTFAHHLPKNSHNAWGWGIYGDNMIRFVSYDEAIFTISQALRTNYIDKWGAKNVYEIGRFYAASPTWANKVSYFMDKIDQFAQKDTVDTLSISI